MLSMIMDFSRISRQKEGLALSAFLPGEENLHRFIRQADMNLSAMELFTRLLYHPRPFSTVEIENFAKDLSMPVESAYPVLLSAACGLESDRNPRHRLMEEKYLFPALRPLDDECYRQNPYYQKIHFSEAQLGGWRLTHLRYAPYEVFPCGNLQPFPDGREIPPLGYFQKEFSYPAVLENGREWMTITPNEIETMKDDLAAARGDILVFGLGLGYFAFMAAEKKEVSSITVIERDEQVIALFRKHLLPQFPHAGKITILCCDAFDNWGGMLPRPGYDFAYFDLWHDAGDGLALYLKLRQMKMPLSIPCTRFWIEQDMLLFLKGLLLDAMKEKSGPIHALLSQEIKSFDSWEGLLSQENLRRLALKIPPEWVERG